MLPQEKGNEKHWMKPPAIWVLQNHSFGDARRVILETILDLRHGKISVERSMAIAANMKVLNDSIQTEVNVAKVAIMAKEKGHDFGKVIKLGHQVIGD